MTLEEAGKNFGIAPRTLKKYVSQGLVRCPGKGDSGYTEEDFQHLGTIALLLKAGFAPEEVAQYLELINRQGTAAEQVRLLRKHRGQLLDEIHEKQQLLDQLDLMIWDQKNGPA